MCSGPWIFKPEWTIRKQMRMGFFSLTFCALITVFLVALITVLALAAATSDTARTNLEDRLKQHALLTTNEVARVISQKLELVAETVVMTLASQSEALLNLKVGSGTNADAEKWPYKDRPRVYGYQICDQDILDSVYAEGGNYCSKGFGDHDDDGNRLKKCSNLYHDGGYPATTECYFTGGSPTGYEPGMAVGTENGVCRAAEGENDHSGCDHDNQTDCENDDDDNDAEAGGGECRWVAWTAADLGYGAKQTMITRRCPGNTSTCVHWASEKFSTADIQLSNTKCDISALKWNKDKAKCANQLSGASDTGSGNCCNAEVDGSYAPRSRVRSDAILTKDLGGVSGVTFEPVVKRTQLLDHYAQPLWQEFEEIDLIYVAYQVPESGSIGYSSDDGKPTSNQDYAALMRRFPGEYLKNNSYDPSKRGWWREAMKFYYGDNEKAKDRVIITSAYQDFGTNRWMVTISKAFEWDSYTETGAVKMPGGVGCASADVVLTDLQAQILGVDFTGGFAGLVHLGTGEVLALNGLTIDDPRCSPEDDGYCGAIGGECYEKCVNTKTIEELEMRNKDDCENPCGEDAAKDCVNECELGFPQADMDKMKAGETGTTEYKRKGENYDEEKEKDAAYEGEDWVVAYAPAFHDELAILLFAPKSEIQNTVDELGVKVGETTGVVIGVVIGVVAVTAAITFLIVYFLIKSIAQPLKNVEKVSNEIVKTSADANRNFRAHIKKIENVPMGDEIGELVHSFRAMVRGLYEADVKKRQAPKYPENTLYGKSGGQPWERGLNVQ